MSDVTDTAHADMLSGETQKNNSVNRLVQLSYVSAAVFAMQQLEFEGSTR